MHADNVQTHPPRDMHPPLNIKIQTLYEVESCTSHAPLQRLENNYVIKLGHATCVYFTDQKVTFNDVSKNEKRK